MDRLGRNRTEALELARGKADYLLLLDADWTFSARPDALERLTADVYLVKYRGAHDDSLEFHNRNLVRGDREVVVRRRGSRIPRNRGTLHCGATRWGVHHELVG